MKIREKEMFKCCSKSSLTSLLGKEKIVSSSVLRRRAQAWVPEESCKVSTLVQRDQDRQDGRTEVIAEPTVAS